MEYLFNQEGTLKEVEEEPPFAVSESPSMGHLPLPTGSMKEKQKNCFPIKGGILDSHQSNSSTVPGLTESILTDDSSLGRSVSSSQIPHSLDLSSTILGTSLSTVPLSSDSITYQRSQMSESTHGRASVSSPREWSTSGFSQLMQAAGDGSNMEFGQSRMPAVPEDDVLDSFEASTFGGALISAPAEFSEDQSLARAPETNYWFFNLLSAAKRRSSAAYFNRYLSVTDSSSRLDTPLLSLTPSAESVCMAKSNVYSRLEDNESFEVHMKVDQPCTVSDVMNIVGNPAYLKMWCNPIEALVVVNSTDARVGSQEETGREYEGEWIEATTTSLESPTCSMSYMYQAGSMVMETVGLGSHGKITMFVERNRGKVSLTVGPFAGGIHASHTISVRQEGEHVRVVDRVRIDQREEDISLARSLFYGGALDSCLSSCLLPKITDYMDQAKTSMARLQILVAIGDLSSRNVIIGAPR